MFLSLMSLRELIQLNIDEKASVKSNQITCQVYTSFNAAQVCYTNEKNNN